MNESGAAESHKVSAIKSVARTKIEKSNQFLSLAKLFPFVGNEKKALGKWRKRSSGKVRYWILFEVFETFMAFMVLQKGCCFC
jgi:hypothetical protein